MRLTTPSSKSKFVLVHAMNASKAAEVVIHSFFSSALFGGDWAVTALPPGKEPLVPFH
jgi:hypothetical protein